MTTVVRVRGGSVHVLATVQGIAAEAERVRAAYRAVRPAAVALGVSEESVAGLREYARQVEAGEDPLAPTRPEEPEGTPRRHADGTLYEEDVVDPYEYEAEDLLTEPEVAYGTALRQFGKVLLPPRDLVTAIELADADDVPVASVDLTEDAYGEVFAKHVSTWQLIRYSRRTRRLGKRPPKAESPRAFALAWDAYLRRLKGVDAVERTRERHMAEQAAALAAEHGVVLLVLEATREQGVLDALRANAA